MIYILSFGIMIYVLYTVYILYRFGIPKSYSNTYYLLHQKWMFSVTMFILAFTAMITGVDTGGPWNFLAFIPAAALTFVAFAPDYKYKGQRKPIENKIHMRASYIAVFGAGLAYWLKFGYLWITIPFFVFVVISGLLRYKSYIFWIEHICFNIYFALLLKSIINY